MKTKTFQMRMSEKTKEKLDRLSKHFNISASAVVDMLIAKEANKCLQDMEVSLNGD